jgi:hypothetical protein
MRRASHTWIFFTVTTAVLTFISASNQGTCLFYRGSHSASATNNVEILALLRNINNVEIGSKLVRT